ncbi:MAG TPA: nucleotidyltransferase family protein [Bacteroidia bacterium]|nr:nucleotidyltransferase family protein [Bacteroidia bacterium]
MIKEAIILAGGFGTRLQPVISDLPKPMAPVNGKPFLHYVLQHISSYGIQKAVLSVGYLAEKVESFFGKEYLSMEILYAHETVPLGTGGGIRLGMEQCTGEHVLAMNGDSLYKCDLRKLAESHLAAYADVTIALRKVPDASRYGTVELEGNRIISFREKSAEVTGPALINSGVYVIRKKTFLDFTASGKAFSIENDFFAKYAGKLQLQGMPGEDYFIDIGIPEDYERAVEELKEGV